ncbi:MbeD family mobilization/exclusion protein [Gilvimarinus sp. DA14]|uniref:MbeD family mobilization/exclusion protein n=1 Tax=Gilvimarinus sp. DA14 TaxID=2956798 RepID=UPI0020B87465|nr:MbeD family mobilization/exclusion protein [Gilvimarinus sp. DA14]UTF60721.1 MbeD family mobilization/exclusion protein [Gilvimarinus sp. DA14]
MSLFTPLRLGAFYFAACTLLSACQTKPVVPPTQSELENYAAQVQRTAVNDLTVIQQCENLGGSIGMLAVTARDTWEFSNSHLLAAAESLQAHQSKDIVHWQDQAYSLQTLAMVKEASQSRAQSLNLSQRVPSAQKATCERELRRIETTSYADIGADPRLSQALLASTSNTTADFAGVTQIADQFSPWPEPGRTYFTLKQSIDKECEANSRIMPLVNRWPDEVYAYFCGDKPISLIECHWVECTSQAAGRAN